MLPQTVTVDQLVRQAIRLPERERVRLIQLVAETLVAPALTASGRNLWHYGAFAGQPMSTEADFVIAEWHPTDEELDGA
ncbi:MAG: hypothetical protein IAE79_13175 [Anaerolinea sp.]|nr:hypothetical protein [Anaerolinea sp.]